MILVSLAALTLALPAVGQVATDTRTEQDGSKTLSHTITVAAPVAEVWTAIATPEGWRTWAVPVANRLAEDADVWETGYDRTARPGGPEAIRHRILASIPGRMLAYRTIRAPTGFPHAETYYRVTSVFELEPVDAGTRVRLTSTGYPDSEAGRTLLGFFTRGNAETLEKLAQRFAKGPIDWNADRPKP